jgi:hypothetical protein
MLSLASSFTAAGCSGGFDTQDGGSSEGGRDAAGDAAGDAWIVAPTEGGIGDQDATTGSPEGSAVDATADAHPESGAMDASTKTDGDASATKEAGSAAEAGCPTGDLECNGVCVQSDVHNCGSCGHDCTNLPHVTGPTSCTAGACAIPTSACASGWADCNGNPDDGCEADLNSAAHCGSCATKCADPTTGSGSATCSATANGYACGIVCTGGTPRPCSGGCVDPSTVNNCGACGNVCPPPGTGTGTTTCSTESDGGHSCGLGCTAPTSLECSGACVDPTQVAHCGACAPCAGPASGAGQATCTNMTCGLVCNAGYQVAGIDCTPMTDIYVSVSQGSDSNSGTLAAPLKTITRALAVARGAATVHVMAGTYSESSTSSDFFIVPDGVTVESYGGGTVTVAGPGKLDSGGYALAFAFRGNGTVRGITVQDYGDPFLMGGIGGATGGSQLLDAVNTVQNQGPITIRAASSTTITNSTLGQVYVGDNAMLAVQGGSMTSPAGTCGAGGMHLLDTSSTGAVTITGASLVSGSMSVAIGTVGSGPFGLVTIASSTLTGPCTRIDQLQGSLELDNDTMTGPMDVGGGSLTINGGSYSSTSAGVLLVVGNGYGNNSLKIRNATLSSTSGAISLTQPGAYDLGTAQSPGNNILRSSTTPSPELQLEGTGISVFASGNTWNPGIQGADSNGHFAAGTQSKGPIGCPNTGLCNFSINDASEAVVF